MPQRLISLLAIAACDAVGLLGCALFVYGVWLFSEPVAFVVAGAFLIGLSVVWSRR